MRRHTVFEWDPSKAAEAAIRRGHISFESAMYVLKDPDGDMFHLEYPDESHSRDEERWMTVASVPDDRNTVVAIVWTPRLIENEMVTRIISARRATKGERHRYEKRIYPFR